MSKATGYFPKMSTPRQVALRVVGFPITKVRVRRGKGRPELVITDPLVGEFAADGSFDFELLELINQLGMRERLPNAGWRKVSLRILIALLRCRTIAVTDEHGS